MFLRSVKVEIVGKKKDVEKAVKSAKEDGLKLPSFPALTSKSEGKKTTTAKIELPENIPLTPAPRNFETFFEIDDFNFERRRLGRPQQRAWKQRQLPQLKQLKK